MATTTERLHIVITGATSGIGMQLAKDYLAKDQHVYAVGRDDFHFLSPALFGHKTTCVCYQEKHVGLRGGSWGDALYPPRNHTMW